MAYSIAKRNELHDEMKQLFVLFERIKNNNNKNNNDDNDGEKLLKNAQEMAQKILLKIDVPINYDPLQLLDSMLITSEEGDEQKDSLMLKIQIRGHFVNLMMNQFDDCILNQDFLDDYVLLYFPLPLNKRQAHLCSYVISVAMWSDHSKLLNSMARYVLESETIVFPQQQMSKNLAEISPKFCAAVISRGYFHRDQTGKDYLTDWLETLGGENITVVDWKSIQLNAAIRYSFHEKPEDFKLHSAILKIIEQKKCYPFTNHFIIDFATNLSNQLADLNSSANNNNNDDSDENEKPFQMTSDILLDRFIMIMTIAMKTSLCSQSNQLKKRLLDKFNNNPILVQILSDSYEESSSSNNNNKNSIAKPMENINDDKQNKTENVIEPVKIDEKKIH
ncbi:hypothetical protein DERF_004314 [Dermatophagoides farinae]|uniref:Uncharacterized protein n=1 Tax=Dermatophagoides farinae TaxID=6954 RepID=A0A922L5E0_DERFA|nr:hypothetical protein DERF_004314 [Dermatophagoides farinae]